MWPSNRQCETWTTSHSETGRRDCLVSDWEVGGAAGAWGAWCRWGAAGLLLLGCRWGAAALVLLARGGPGAAGVARGVPLAELVLLAARRQPPA